jgi:hypothetical protein
MKLIERNILIKVTDDVQIGWIQFASNRKDDDERKQSAQIVNE